ncbi:uncharacterized protein [Antedon mediterranea]|uniref:uncharacterized protein n=1 Tax=Antedon mediterranea TaxID=105859 RepID=UPI003AF71049
MSEGDYLFQLIIRLCKQEVKKEVIEEHEQYNEQCMQPSVDILVINKDMKITVKVEDGKWDFQDNVKTIPADYIWGPWGQRPHMRFELQSKSENLLNATIEWSQEDNKTHSIKVIENPENPCLKYMKSCWRFIKGI